MVIYPGVNNKRSGLHWIVGLFSCGLACALHLAGFGARDGAGDKILFVRLETKNMFFLFYWKLK